MQSPSEHRVNRIVVPVNGQRYDERAIRVAAQIAAKKSIDLAVVHVVEVPQQLPLDAEIPGEIERGEAILRSAEDLAITLLDGKNVRIDAELLQARSAGTAIVDEAIERRTHLIVMATRIRVRHGRASLGETARYILQSAPCEVLLLREAVSLAPDDVLLAPETAMAGGRR